MEDGRINVKQRHAKPKGDPYILRERRKEKVFQIVETCYCKWRGCGMIGII